MREARLLDLVVQRRDHRLRPIRALRQQGEAEDRQVHAVRGIDAGEQPDPQLGGFAAVVAALAVGADGVAPGHGFERLLGLCLHVLELLEGGAAG